MKKNQLQHESHRSKQIKQIVAYKKGRSKRSFFMHLCKFKRIPELVNLIQRKN
jgi:hypothetical protein